MTDDPSRYEDDELLQHCASNVGDAESSNELVKRINARAVESLSNSLKKDRNKDVKEYLALNTGSGTSAAQEIINETWVNRRVHEKMRAVLPEITGGFEGLLAWFMQFVRWDFNTLGRKVGKARRDHEGYVQAREAGVDRGQEEEQQGGHGVVTIADRNDAPVVTDGGSIHPDIIYKLAEALGEECAEVYRLIKVELLKIDDVVEVMKPLSKDKVTKHRDRASEFVRKYLKDRLPGERPRGDD